MLKRTLLLLSVALLCAGRLSAVSVTIDAGLLRGFDNSLLTPGSLLLLIAAPATTTTGGVPSYAPFDSVPLTAGEFVNNGDTIVEAFATNNAGGANSMPAYNGETQNVANFSYNTVNNTPSISTFDAGDKVALRFFDGFTFSQYQANATPAAGVHYGTYTTPANTTPDGGYDFTGPPNNSNLGLGDGYNLYTTDNPQTGSQAPSAATASLTVLAVPEPSSFASLGLGFLGLLVLTRASRPARA